MQTKLYVQEASEGNYLVIKPVPGQVVAQVDAGPHMQDYAQLFAAAPQLLEAVQHVLDASENGGTMDDIDLSFLRSVTKKACPRDEIENCGIARALSKYGRVTKLS